MNHPVILAVPVLMLLDYVLTILGAKASGGVYRQHFTSPHYELNPRWQESVRQLRWFNPRHFIRVCIVTALLVLLDRMPDFPWESLELGVGMLLGTYGAICGRHLTNLLLFRYLNRHPAEIEGQVHLTHKLVLRLSLFNHLGLVPLLGMIAVLVPQLYAIGAFLGVLAVAFAHLVWARKAKSQESCKALSAVAGLPAVRRAWLGKSDYCPHPSPLPVGEGTHLAPLDRRVTVQEPSGCSRKSAIVVTGPGVEYVFVVQFAAAQLLELGPAVSTAAPSSRPTTYSLPSASTGEA